MDKFFLTTRNRAYIPSRKKLVVSEKCYYDALKDEYDIETTPMLYGYEGMTENDLSYTVRVTEKVLDRVSEKLESYYHPGYDSNQWRFILYSYINDIVIVCFERYNKIKDISIEEYSTMGIKRPIHVPVDYWEYAMVADDYNCYIYSVIAETLGMKIRYRCGNNLKYWQSENYLKFVKNKYKRYLIRFLCEKNQKIRRHYLGDRYISEINCETLLVTTRLDKNIEKRILQRNSNVKSLGEDNFVKIVTEQCFGCFYNRRLRKKVFFNSIIDIEDKFEAICYKVVANYLPIALVEQFSQIERVANELAGKMHTNQIYSAASMGCADCSLENMVGAKLRKRGVRVIDIQHALGEGYARLITDNIYNVGFDSYLTWGWSESRYINSMPKCIIRVPQQTESIDYKEKKGRILFVCLPERATYAYWEANIVNREENLYKFFDNLDSSTRKKIVVRVKYSIEADFCKKLLKRYPELTIETQAEVPIYESVLKSELVINEYYGSSSAEAMIYGCPTVIFEVTPCTICNDEIKKQLNLLLDAGIYYAGDMGDKLAEFINITNDFSEWWKNKQPIVNTYLENAVGDYQQLEKIWEDEFTSKKVVNTTK